ncbi:mechanosensitive ion channel family protein [Actinosynnema sp. CS-041913]|uniref:mechanosensitive ion channel family protein n=1 Tax=Actinosynnema sp. CS-041913 TaxID=3239917 RepID=UPI003D944DC1
MNALLAVQTAQAQGIGEATGDALRSVVTFLPKLVGFLVVLLIGWIVARVLRTAVRKVLERVHFDRAVQRGGLSDAMARSKFDASGLVSQIVYYGILLIALQIAFGLFGSNPVSNLLTEIVAWLPRAIVAIVIIVVAAAIARAVRDLAGRAMSGLSYGRTVANVASWFIIGLGVIAALNQIGVATTVTLPILITILATVGGIAVVGVGGGLVKPMQQRWEGWLTRAENEVPQAKAQAEAYQRGREDVRRTQEAPTQQVPRVHADTPAHAATMPTPPVGNPVQPQPNPGQRPPQQ